MKSLLLLITLTWAADNSFVRDVSKIFDQMLLYRGPDPTLSCEFALAFPTIAVHCTDGTLTFDTISNVIEPLLRP